MQSILTNDHFLLGLGLAVGPAFILIFGVYAFFKWGKSWKGIVSQCDKPDCGEHIGIVKDIAFTALECKSIWEEIKAINKRQMSLREKLPQQYVSRDDLIGIQERLRSIDGKLDRYLELSVLRKNHDT